MTKVETHVTAEDAASITSALMAIDAEVRSQQGGAIGTGLYALLELAGTQLMGLPRTPGWSPAPPPDPPTTQAATDFEKRQSEEHEAKKEPPKHETKAPPPAPPRR